ncbi:MAG: NAD(P)-binding protein [Mahellales bacterium]|jgi:heterodisulfide reductase subunit A-like polyferredoxin
MKKPVLVLGGGIAGIQTSLDLAEMGIPVFLVENSPSIGGRMAQLDKTFPTNDCSACILAPKVTSCYNHPLIKTLSWSELLELKGQAPDFTAVIKKKARFIDENLCTGCTECTLECPIEQKNEFEMGLSNRKAIYKPFAQAAPNKVTIDKKGTSPCKFKCPAHINAHGYVALIGQGRYEEALGLVREVTPFAGVLGRVCLHPCESRCSRQYVDTPISIASLKRFIADYEIKQGKTPVINIDTHPKNKKVGIIGSGPAGLNCAYKLRLMGYDVTVFEALPVPGGMLRVGIPDYRLDKKVLDREIKIIQDMGVEIKCNTPIGKDITFDELRRQGYKAFFVAIGAHKDMKLGLAEEDIAGIISSVDFLRDLNLGHQPQVGKRVLVIGGGNVAMDAARSALRLGSDVTVVYRRTEEEMPANDWEIEHAKEEGVKFQYLTSPIEVVAKDGKLIGLKCIKNKLGQPDSSGRRRPVAIEGSEFLQECDTVILAIGQRVDMTMLEAAGGPDANRYGNILCNDDMTTNIDDIFAGGDAVTGPATMVEAVAAGNKAALSIHNYLSGDKVPIEPFLLPETKIEEMSFKGLNPRSRANMPMLDLQHRIGTFKEVELGLTEDQAKAEALRCVDCSICSECKACERTCQAGAVRHEQRDEIIEIPVSAAIIATGFDPSSEIPDEFGYTKYDDVVTSMEYERILSASGPYGGHVKRPSDGKEPERIAFIQCVGSRDNSCDKDYCSGVCCMYAVKEAIITREHLPSVKDVDIFYMDMRSYGKDFDKYIDSAQNKYNVGFIKSRISEVVRNDTTGRLEIKYCDDKGDMAVDQYDLVVLSVGLNPRTGVQSLLESSNVKTDKYGFCWINEMDPPRTTSDGIFACGVAAGPKDIPETVVEASAAASAAAITAGKRSVELSDYSKFFEQPQDIPMRDVSKEPIRIGVFVCHCGSNIGGFLNVKEVVEYAKTLPFVEHCEDNMYTCSVDSQKVIAERIREFNLNRVVVASCTPRTHEPLFQEVLVKAGLNPYLFAMANIRDQCSWVHMDRYEEATQKAKDLVKMAVGKVTFAKQLTRQKVEVNKGALVIGGGMSGISAALEIAGMGFKVYLVEKTGQLGGNALKLGFTASGRSYGDHIRRYIDALNNNPNIEVFLNTEIKRIDGYVGKFKTLLQSDGNEREIDHGCVIVATGAREYKPKEYMYGSDDRVMTQMELEERLAGNKLDIGKYKNIVMIQCVGSREADRPYCSRVCCNQAIKNAILLKEMDKDINVTILYRDIRSYGLNEINYRIARRTGVQFINYNPELKPVLANEGDGLKLKCYESLLDGQVEMPVDMVVLSSAIEVDLEENKRIAQMLKVPLNQEGFFMEAHAKLRPVDFATEGVYLCGLAHAPKNLKESIAQGRAAAARAATVISKDTLETEANIAQVREDLCSGCGTCERVCAYKAITLEDIKRRNETVKKAVVNAVLCKGCGTCSANCRCGAIDVNGFADRQVLSEIEYLLTT